jgi:hypothetical protein
MTGTREKITFSPRTIEVLNKLIPPAKSVLVLCGAVMRLRIAIASPALLFGLGNGTRADAIPYPNSGTPDTASYVFTAAVTGIIAYFGGACGALLALPRRRRKLVIA